MRTNNKTSNNTVQKAQKGKPVKKASTAKKTTAAKSTTQNPLITTSKYNTVEDLPFYRRRFYENLNPYNYDVLGENAIQRGFNTIILNNVEEEKIKHDKKLAEHLKKGEKKNRVRRDDAQRVAVGLPQRSGTFKEPTYEPSKKENSILQSLGITSKTPTYEFTDPGILEYLKAYSNYPELFDEKGVLLDEDNVAGVMGNFKISKGKDEKGEYLSYYDRYNFEPLRNSGIPIIENISLPITDDFDTYGRYYLNDKSVKNNPKYKKHIESQKKELLNKKEQRNKNYRKANYTSSLGTPGIRQYGGVPQAQFGDLLSSGPLADLFKSGEEWNKAWRGNIFDKSGLLNKTIYQNQKDIKPEQMYGDPNSPFYDPNYASNMETAKEEAQSDYDTQYQMYLDAKQKAAETGEFFDEREWEGVLYGPETYTDKVMSGNANIAQYKPKSDAQKLQQTAQGIFSGLQYQGAYQKPEPVKLEEGFQGTQWAQYGNSVPERYNNPMNLMYTKTTRSYGAEDSGKKQLDGSLNFAKFDNPRKGISAATKLLSEKYEDKTVDETLKKYSNQGYDSKIIKSITKDKKIKDLNKTELKKLLEVMGKNEMPRKYYDELSSSDMFNPQYELNQSVKNMRLIDNSVPQESTNINNMYYQTGGGVPASNVSRVSRDPSSIISSLRNLGYLKDYSDDEILSMSPEQQETIFQSEMKQFNETDPRSGRNKKISGEVIEEIVTPLTTAVREVIPGQTQMTEMSEEDEFIDWYRKQPEGTIQEYKGRKIKIDRSGDGSSTRQRSKNEQIITTTPDKVVIKSGLAKDIYNKRYGGTSNKYYQEGGPVNYTGYTPEFDTSNNPMNIIPGQTVSMNPQMGSPVTEPLLAIANFGKKKNYTGTNHGLIKNLEPGDEWNVPGASRIVELKKDYKQDTNQSKYGNPVNKSKIRYGGNISEIIMRNSVPNFQNSGEVVLNTAPNDMYSPWETSSVTTDSVINPLANLSRIHQLISKNPDIIRDPNSDPARRYLAEMAQGSDIGPAYSTQEFNEKMIAGRNAGILADISRQVAMEDTERTRPKDDYEQIARQQEALTADSIPYWQMQTDPNQVSPAFMEGQVVDKISPKGISEIYNLQGDKNYEYAKDKNGNWLTRKKGSNSDWNIISRSGLDKSQIDQAISKLDKSARKVGGKNVNLVTDIDWSGNTISTRAVQKTKGSKKYQYGGEINSDHTFPIHPITEEFTEIQTEKGETVFLPDGTIVEVKADKLHKNMDKDKITDILPEGAYIFSRDPYMKMGPNTKIGGVRLSDMKVGKTVFEYKENELTTGPKDIMISDIFNLKKDTTPADISRNIKKKFEVRDMKNDFFVQRANDENKKQRVEYFEILKTFSEFKKPKSKREVPKAQYGMNIASDYDLNNMFDQQANSTLNNIMGYSNESLDPYSKVDNTFKSRYNISSTSPMSFANGGGVPHAGIGDLVKLSPAYWLGDYMVGQKAERQNRKLAQERSGIWEQKGKDIKKVGAMNIGTNLGTYAASLNVPDMKYTDYGTEFATTQDAYRRAKAIQDASKYAASQGLGASASMARYMNPANMGNYLAQSAAANQGVVQNAAALEANMGLQEAEALNRYRTAGTEAYNAAANARAQQMYNANVTGLGNVGRAGTDYLSSMGDYRFDRGMDKMAYDTYLEQRKQAARDRYSNTVTGIAGGVAELGMMFVPGGALAKGAAGGAGKFIDNFNPAFTSPASQQFGDSFSNTTMVPGGTVNRGGFPYLGGLPFGRG